MGKLFDWQDFGNNIATSRSDKETYNSSKIIRDLTAPKPNYTKRQIEERLLQAGDKIRRDLLHLTQRQTIVVMVITSNLTKAELEY